MSSFILPDFMVDPERTRVWRRVMVRLSFLGMGPIDLAAAIHSDELYGMTGDDGDLTELGLKKLRMHNVHLHQKLNGIRKYDQPYISRVEAALGLPEGALLRGRWVDLLKK